MALTIRNWLIRCFAALVLVAQASAPLSAFAPNIIEICAGHGIRLIAVAPDIVEINAAPGCALCIAAEIAPTIAQPPAPGAAIRLEPVRHRASTTGDAPPARLLRACARAPPFSAV